MKKLAVFIGLLLPLLFLLPYALQTAKDKVKEDLAKPVHSSIEPTLSPTRTIPKATQEKTSIFVPYWSLSSRNTSFSEYDELIYFGITPTVKGIDTDEVGYKSLKRFIRMAGEKKKTSLTLRMLDSTVNLAVLKDKKLQQTVVKQTVDLAKEHGFDGIVLDLELTALPFSSTITQINSLVSQLSSEAKKDDLSFAVLLYGDTFYRVRPFEVKTIAKSVDEVMIMAYDFHKSRGNPGPNFPLDGRNVYGYDFKKMTDDYLQFVPPEKLTIVFGLFGYDWEVDGSQKAIVNGSSLSFDKIDQSFLEKCMYQDCKTTRDPVSSETRVTYTDGEKKHVVWFEDMTSVAKKQEFLETRGITSSSFWAYSYF
ncbi:MAG: hypothetical protein HY428_02165 [Candidatus Levybacteria bacterium]|nr:hypothetical protein [Candidatus Levybacteria bacterium]